MKDTAIEFNKLFSSISNSDMLLDLDDDNVLKGNTEETVTLYDKSGIPIRCIGPVQIMWNSFKKGVLCQ